METQSVREKPLSLRPETQTAKPVLDGKAITDEALIKRTFLNNTAVNVDAFSDNISMISGYPEGRIISVTYYSQSAPVTDVQSKVLITNIATIDSVHLRFKEIRDFEIRCPSEFSYEYDTSNNLSTITGEATILPNFSPFVGDLFLYQLQNGKIGVFIVTEVSRLALNHESYHHIKFVLLEFLDNTKRDILNRCSDVYYFDKTKFLTGNHAFLTSETYIQKNELTRIRLEIIQDYMNRFYTKSFSSFVRPDGIYDPYVVEYWNKKISYKDCNVRPIQLLVAMDNFHKTIWGVLTTNPIKVVSNIDKYSKVQQYDTHFWSVNITSLLGHKFLTVGNDSGAIMAPTAVTDNGFDLTPTFHFTGRDDEIKDKLAKEAADKFRKDFYEDILPCGECYTHTDACSCCDSACHCYSHLEEPPFPILSDDELFAIWRLVHRIPDNYHYQKHEVFTVRGFVDWYRKKYPGTLSHIELEKEWRKLAGIEPDEKLTPGQYAGLSKYIASYRSKFKQVLNDRELEIVFKTENRIPLEATLRPDQRKDFYKYVEDYRHKHGDVPEDQMDRWNPPFEPDTNPTETWDMLAIVGYGQAGRARLFDKVNHNRDPIPPDWVPTEYKEPHKIHRWVTAKPCDCEERHTNPTHIHHDCDCHHVCPPAPIEEPPTYVLSNDFYRGSATMNSLEALVYACITGREFSVARVLDECTRYLEMSDEQAYYQELLLLYLIDKSLYWLANHN